MDLLKVGQVLSTPNLGSREKIMLLFFAFESLLLRDKQYKLCGVDKLGLEDGQVVKDWVTNRSFI